MASNLRLFLFFCFGLLIFGFLMLYSSSYHLGVEVHEDGFFYVKRQLRALMVGMIAFFIIYKLKLKTLKEMTPVLFIIGLILLIMPLIPGLGHKGGGANRWVDFGFFSFQPSELVKILFVIILATGLTKLDGKQAFPYLKKLIMPFCLSVLMVVQPDFGSFMVCMIVASILLFVSHFPLKYLMGFFTILFSGAYFLIEYFPYRKARVLSFLNPWNNESTGGFQIIQSFVGLRSGGFWGVGLGNSQEKLLFLPAAHNDFILAIIGEELGLLGLLVLLGAFLGFLLFGFSIALKTQNLFKKSIVVGSVSLIALQAFLHFGVNLGVLPTKGLNLPFISYGGSSLIACCIIVGLICNVSKDRTLD